MIKLKNINKLYEFNHINKKVVKMSKSKEDKSMLKEGEIKSFNENIKAVEKLDVALKLAFKQTTTTGNTIVCTLGLKVLDYIKEFKLNLENLTKTDDMLNYISKKGLTTFCYERVNYNRKEGVNDLFEKVVSRAIRLALMLEDFPNEFSVDEKKGQVFIMSKILEPFNTIKVEGSKVSKKVVNKDETLLPVTTYTVDKVYQRKYPTGKRTTKTKDANAINNFKNVMRDALKGIKQVINYANKKDVKFFDMIDEDTFENIIEFNELTTKKDFDVVRSFSVEYRPDFNGKLEKIA